MKKILKPILIIIGIFAVFLILCSFLTVGDIGGPENEYIIINGVKEYVLDNNSGFTIKDRGRFIGFLRGPGEMLYFTYSVDRGEPYEYLYAASTGRGAFYMRVD